MKQTPFTRKLVEELRIVDILSQRFDSLMYHLLSGQVMARDAMVDILKLTFNLLLQYPRMVDTEEDKNKDNVREDTTPSGHMGELWSSNLEKCVLGLVFELTPQFNFHPVSCRLCCDCSMVSLQHSQIPSHHL